MSLASRSAHVTARDLTRRLGAALVVAATLTAALVVEAAAPAGRYTISGGIVYDTKTRLTWQQSPGPSTYTLPAGEAYCAGLSSGGLAWRVPTTKELETIVDPTLGAPAIDPTAFPGTPLSYFWTSTPYEPQSGDAWLVYFSDGSLAYVQTNYVTNVRCVH
jgi:hypothetical protein